MCIAILNKKTTLSKETFDTISQNNYDGIGFAFSDGRKIQIFKTMDKVDKLYAQYVREREKHDTPFLIHARISTHGKVNVQNVHPFQVTPDIALIHNGIVDAPNLHPDKSDTWHFTKWIEMLKKPYNVFNDGTMESAWMETMTAGSKFVLLHTNGRYKIYGERLGHWVDDTWYSNYTYKQYGLYDRGGVSCAKPSAKKYYDVMYDDDTAFGYDVKTDKRYDFLHDYPAKKSTTKPFITDYAKRNDILNALGYNPYNMSTTEREKVVLEYMMEFQMSLNELYEECQTWAE